ncbi:hypothetical protein BGZ99_009300, partial [Dissophora globulifera]
MEERHISLSMPASPSSLSDASGHDGYIQDSRPLPTAQNEDGDDNSDVPTAADVSETDKEKDTEDSNGDGGSDGNSPDEDSNGNSHDEDNEDDIGSPVVRSYFELMEPVVKNDTAAASIQLKCTKTASAPASIGFRSKSVEWTLYPHGLDATKDYELVIGISAKRLRIVDIEDIVVTANGVEERVEQESYKDEVIDGTEVMRWKLATPKSVQNNNRMEMRVSFALKLKPMPAPLETETFNLYYTELHAVGASNLSMDPFVRVLRPLYDRVLDIRRDGADEAIPYAISESGDYLVTYRNAIELWDLTNSGLSEPLDSYPINISDADLEHLSLSISWDGSQIAMSGKRSLFKLYEYNRSKSMLEESTKAKTIDFTAFGGQASFHAGTESQRRCLEDEIFVTVDLNTVGIYSVYGAWRYLRTIPHTSSVVSKLVWHAQSITQGIGNRIQGRHFICRNIDSSNLTGSRTKSILIWNLDSGRLVNTIKAAGSVFYDTEFLSSDASLLLEEVDGVMTSFCSRTGVRLATAGHQLRSAVPVKGSNSLFHTSDGFIRSGVDLAPIYPSCKLPESATVLSIFKEGESFNAYVEDRFSIYRQTWKSSPCNAVCLANLRAVREDVWSFVDFESGLEFSVEDKMETARRSLQLVISDLTQQDESRKTILDSLRRDYKTEVTFSPKDRVLIVKGETLTWIYEMPRRYSDDVLLVAIQDPEVQHWTCVHDRSYFRFHPDFLSLSQLKDAQCEGVTSVLAWRYHWYSVISHNPRFLTYLNRHINPRDGWGVEDGTQMANNESTIERLCYDWFSDSDDLSPLLEQVLGLSECQWVPSSKIEFNPIKYFLLTSKALPDAKAMFHFLSGYCHGRAISEQNLIFLSPVAACLPALLDPDQPHYKTAMLALRKMAFFPVPVRSVIIERHAMIHPPEFRVKFWTPNPRKLFQCREPILQLESSRASVVRMDPTWKSFRDEIFAATFNMIWTDKNEPHAPSDTSHPAGMCPSVFYWIRMTPFVIRYKLNPRIEKTVKCHKFPLDALDNPALCALILYKWSTLGFYIWLSRFTFQCILYTLVVVMVFFQVYAPTHNSLTVLSGIIAVMSSTFLLLELPHLLHSPMKYLRSMPYNFVDIAVFAFPLGGCINQFYLGSTINEDNILNPRGPNSWVFSFSILVIALHLLLQLCVNRTLCRFVTAMLRIFNRIRSVFIIFLIGQLAFTTALLHLLRGCVQEPCADLTTTGFPGNFYLAFSATFFFMVGKFEPIDDAFTEPNWAFHTMMIAYLIFTVILMLNVLIVLINSGYDESDTTWELVWLQNQLLYIESAENLSHFIPGLRENFDIFPQEIYYCLSETKIQT